jgi:aromatic-amino-acid transaminase
MSLFANVELAPRDPILGLNEAFNADTRSSKVNLGVGVYTTDEGKIPLLDCVHEAESTRLAGAPARGYLPIDGVVAYNKAVQALLLGTESPIVKEGRALTVQALGGTGALKIGADYLQRLAPNAAVWISDPSWENHRALFESAGFTVKQYAYYDAATRGLDFAGLHRDLLSAARGDIIVLHACCHNPTGVDLDDGQWTTVIDLLKDRGIIPFLDIAYQGFADGLEPDGAVVGKIAASGMEFFVSSSFSKSFSLYGERVGALTVVTNSRDETARVLSQVKRVVRTNYSNPPTHGAAVVAAVLQSPELRALWESELGGMRERIRAMRAGLVDRLKARSVPGDYGFVLRQRGMFSYSGLSPTQVDRLRDEFAIYAVGTGRICLAALNNRNIDYVADAIAKVA